MKKFIAFLSIIFIVSMFSYDVGASPPTYNETGFYEVPSFNIDAINFVIEDPQITDVATIDIYQSLNITAVDYEYIIISDGKVQNSQINLYLYRDKALYSENNLLVTTYCNYPLLCYSSYKHEDYTKTQKNLYRNISHISLADYSLIGYSMKS